MNKQQNIIENQVALFNLICSLYKDTTGKIPIVRIWTKDGDILSSPSLYNITFQEVVSPCSAENQKETDKVS